MYLADVMMNVFGSSSLSPVGFPQDLELSQSDSDSKIFCLQVSQKKISEDVQYIVGAVSNLIRVTDCLNCAINTLMPAIFEIQKHLASSSSSSNLMSFHNLSPLSDSQESSSLFPSSLSPSSLSTSFSQVEYDDSDASQPDEKTVKSRKRALSQSECDDNSVQPKKSKDNKSKTKKTKKLSKTEIDEFENALLFLVFAFCNTKTNHFVYYPRTANKQLVLVFFTQITLILINSVRKFLFDNRTVTWTKMNAFINCFHQQHSIAFDDLDTTNHPRNQDFYAWFQKYSPCLPRAYGRPKASSKGKVVFDKTSDPLTNVFIVTEKQLLDLITKHRFSFDQLPQRELERILNLGQSISQTAFENREPKPVLKFIRTYHHVLDKYKDADAKMQNPLPIILPYPASHEQLLSPEIDYSVFFHSKLFHIMFPMNDTQKKKFISLWGHTHYEWRLQRPSNEEELPSKKSNKKQQDISGSTTSDLKVESHKSIIKKILNGWHIPFCKIAKSKKSK